MLWINNASKVDISQLHASKADKYALFDLTRNSRFVGLVTLQVLTELLTKSVNFTMAINDALQKIRKASEARNEFMNEFLSPSSRTNPQEADSMIFVSVVSSLESDGTFWCQYWNSSSTCITSQDLKIISDELGWQERELNVKVAEDNLLKTPLFTYSTEKQMYVRVVIWKYEQDDQVAVRFLDTGLMGRIPASSVFYHVPIEIEEKYPYKSMFCTLLAEEKADFPYEAKWQFRDLTTEKVLMARILSKVKRKGMTCNVIDISESISINEKVLKKVDEHAAMQEEVHRSDMYQARPSTPVLSHSKSKSVKKEESLFKKPVVPSKKIKQDAPLKKTKQDISSIRERSSSHLLSRQVISPIRSASLTSLVVEKPKLELSRSHESLLRDVTKHAALSKDASSVGSNKRQSGTKKIDKTPKVSKRKKDKLSQKKERSDSESKIEEYWVDKIPDTVRSNVPKVLPPVHNLFYTANKLREETWQEIELMNLTKILHSQAMIRFVCCDVSENRLASSLRQNGLLKLHRTSMEALLNGPTGCSQYLVLRKFVYKKEHEEKEHDRKNTILGIARVEYLHGCTDNKLPVVFFCLSKLPFTPNARWHLTPIAAKISLLDAKEIILAYRKALRMKKTEPVFPKYYPWCGVPPLMDMSKPTSQRSVGRSNKENSVNTSCGKPVIEEPQIPFSDMQCESWESELQECNPAENEKEMNIPVNVLPHDSFDQTSHSPQNSIDQNTNFPQDSIDQNTDSHQNSHDQNTDSIDQNTDSIEQNSTSPQSSINQNSDFLFRPLKILQRSETIKGLKVRSCEEIESEMFENNNVVIQIKRDDISGGFYDSHGVWYPTVAAAKVDTRKVVDEKLSVDIDHDILSSTRTSNSSTSDDSNFSSPKERVVHVLKDGEDFDNDSGCSIDFEKSVEQIISSVTSVITKRGNPANKKKVEVNGD